METCGFAYLIPVPEVANQQKMSVHPASHGTYGSPSVRFLSANT
jgi:hypothetical protein